MKIDKKFKKFYEVGSNRYYVLNFDKELYLATESFLELPKKLFRKNKLTQTLKLLELNPPILLLFDELISTKILEKDEEFPDMCKYEKIDNVKIRKEIDKIYKQALDIEVSEIYDDFQKWVAEFEKFGKDKFTEKEIEDTIAVNEIRVNKIVEDYVTSSKYNRTDTNIPNRKLDNDVVKKMITSGLSFLCSQLLNSNAKIYYLYDLDCFGTITIYKVICVKEVVKSIDTFIYNREIAQELLAFINNNEL